MREFIARVASAREPVPAGGSVVALTGASSAALLVLVCGVLQRKDVPSVAELSARAAVLQERLLALVDLDAAAFRAFLDDKHGQAAIMRLSETPIEIAQSCAELAALSLRIERHTSGPMQGDLRAARHLALAGLDAALDIAKQNISVQADPLAQRRLRAQIAALRRRH